MRYGTIQVVWREEDPTRLGSPTLTHLDPEVISTGEGTVELRVVHHACRQAGGQLGTYGNQAGKQAPAGRPADRLAGGRAGGLEGGRIWEEDSGWGGLLARRGVGP